MISAVPDDPRTVWVLQRLEGGEWVDVLTEHSVPEIRDRHAQAAASDPAHTYRVVAGDSPLPDGLWTTPGRTMMTNQHESLEALREHNAYFTRTAKKIILGSKGDEVLQAQLLAQVFHDSAQSLTSQDPNRILSGLLAEMHLQEARRQLREGSSDV